jgi:acyl-CoA thioester hydrolase
MKANQLTLRLDWSEMDLFGHINNVSYFKYLQASRVNFWEALGMNKLYESEGIGPSLAKTSCAFLKPLHYPGTIRIEITVDWIKNSSFQLHHRLYDASENLCAEGEDVVVLFDYRKNQKFLLTEEQVTQLREYAG